MLRIGFLFALTVGTARAEEAARPLLLFHPSLSRDATDPVAREAARRGIEVASPAPLPEPASESLLAEVRPLYQNMSFAAAAKKLETEEASLLAGRLPSPALVRALSELELWRGACLFLARDRAGAEEPWALALRLRPLARLDAIFPPEVQRAFSRRRPAARPVAVAVKLAPLGARLWLDGKLVALDVPLSATPGLHYAVVERADQRPSAEVLRIIRASPQITVSLQTPAELPDALRQAEARLRTAPLSRDEALGVSAAIARPLVLVESRGGQLVATRYAAGDATRPVSESEGADGASLIAALCASDAGCAKLEPPPSVTTGPGLQVGAPPARMATAAAAPAAPPTTKPVWKRGWFWGVLGASVAVAAGAATGIGVGATAPRNYDLRVR